MVKPINYLSSGALESLKSLPITAVIIFTAF